MGSLLVGREPDGYGYEVRWEVVGILKIADVFDEGLGRARIDLAPDHPVRGA